MQQIIKNCPCSLQAWIGAGEPVLEEGGLYFSRKDEVRETGNSKSSKVRWWSATFINSTMVNRVRYQCALG